jgi:DNA replication protein DnaC
MNGNLMQMLKQLRLSGLIESLEVRLQEAVGNGLSHAEFLELVLSDELATRQQRAIDRRLKQAQFREMKTLDQLDFSFNPSLPKRRIMDLATGRFIREATDVLLLGPPGTGKSHCCQAVGRSAIKAGFSVLYRSIFDVVRDFLHEVAFDGDDKRLERYLKPDLLIIDDMGMKQLPKRSGECLFEIILRRHEVKSTMMTSNRPLQDWGKLIGDVPAATAILDRFLEHAEIIQITGQSYRLRNKTAEKNDAEETPLPDAKTGQDELTNPDAKTGQSAHRVPEEKSPQKNCPESKQAKRSKDQKTPPEA